MLRRLTTVTALAAGLSIAAVMTLATPAFAKGPSQVSITGPGLARPVVVSGDGEPGQQGRLASLALQTGLFTVMFGAGASIAGPAPARLHTPPPQASLGPRYTLVYTVPGVTPRPGQQFGRVRQDLYPRAAGRPTHLHATRPAGLRGAPDGQRMAPGQAAADPHAGPGRRSTGGRPAGGASDPPCRGRASGGSASGGRANPRLDHRTGRGHRGRSARRHRVVAAPPQAGRRTRRRAPDQRVSLRDT